MYSRNSFGSYYPIDSAIHKLTPVTKLFLFIFMILVIIITHSWVVNSFLLVFTIIMMFLSYVPIRYYFNTFWSLRYLYLLVVFICYFFRTSMTDCLVYIEKIIIFVEYINILAFTTSPSENIYGIEKFLSLFNVFYIKVGKIATKINELIRYFPLYVTTKYKTYKAASSRGISISKINIFKRIKFDNNVRKLTKLKNKDIKEYSELRLYDINKYRTNYRTNKIGYYDILFILFHLVLIYASLVEEGIL